MALPLFSQRITTLKSNPSSLNLISNTHKKNPNFRIIKAELANGDQAQRGIKTQQQQKQPIKRRVTQAQAPPIGLWDRFPAARTVQQMMDTMDRLIEDPPSYTGGNGSAWASPMDTATYNRGRTPWEIKEGEQDYKLRFDMPGMTKEDVKVYVEEQMLVIKAEKIAKENDEEGEWSGKSYGKYSFRILLPENIQFEKIKAEVRDGVLYVTIPKAPVSAKVLDISVE